MIETLRSTAAEAQARLAEVADLEALAQLDIEFLGKKSALTLAKRQLGSLAPEQRRTAGQALNQIRAEIEGAVGAARERLARAALSERIEAERLDLTEFRGTARRGSLHLVTQARDRLEDVFVGWIHGSRGPRSRVCLVQLRGAQHS